MNPLWEKGVVIGKTTNSERYFVASSYDTLIMYKAQVGTHQLGDCIEFIGARLANPYERVVYERQVTTIRKCAKFVQFEQDSNKNSCLLICDIVRVRIVYHQESDSMVRMLRTNFLEEVLDASVNCYTYSYTDEELLKMRVVCKRIVNEKSKKEFWSVYKLRQRIVGNNEASIDIEERERGILSTDKPEKKLIEREVLHGFVATTGTTKHGKDELYIWVPFRKKDLFFPATLRPTANRSIYIGRWLTFSVNEKGVLDSLSDVQISEKDYLPTRRRSNRNENLVPCSFNTDHYYGWGNPILGSKMCGPIVDASGVLKKYNRLRRSFTGTAWVFCFLYDAGVRFVLSDCQEEWVEEGQRRNRNNSGRRSFPDNRNEGRPNISRRSLSRSRLPMTDVRDFQSYQPNEFESDRTSFREERMPFGRQSRRIDYENENEGSWIRDQSRQSFSGEYCGKERSRSLSNHRNERAELQQRYDSRLFERKENRDFDEEDDFDSEDDGDSTLLQAPVEPVEISRNLVSPPLRSILKKTKVEKLTEELECIQSSSCVKLIPSGEKEQKNEREESIRRLKQAAEDLRRLKEDEKVKQLELELKNHKNVVELVREIMASPRVRNAMRQFNVDITDELIESLCNL